MAAMRWRGWGNEGVSFTHEDKPVLEWAVAEGLVTRPLPRGIDSPA